MTRPKILFLDIETSPILAYVWRIGPKYNLLHENIKSGQKCEIICACYKWDGCAQVQGLTWDKDQDSTALLLALKHEIEQADLVVAHAGDRFDVKHINAQCLIHGVEPIAWPQTFDTLKQCRSAFYLASFKLDYLSKLLLHDSKHQMVFEDWIEVVEKRNPKALQKMVRYCAQDVQLLSRVYHKVRPYLTSKANLGLVSGDRYGCPICGSKQSKSMGVRHGKARSYQRRRCLMCRHIFQGPSEVI